MIGDIFVILFLYMGVTVFLDAMVEEVIVVCRGFDECLDFSVSVFDSLLFWFAFPFTFGQVLYPFLSLLCNLEIFVGVLELCQLSNPSFFELRSVKMYC